MSSLLSVLIFVCECNKSIDDRSVMAVNYARRETELLIFNDDHKTPQDITLILSAAHSNTSQPGRIDTTLNVNKSKETGVVGDCLY